VALLRKVAEVYDAEVSAAAADGRRAKPRIAASAMLEAAGERPGDRTVSRLIAQCRDLGLITAQRHRGGTGRARAASQESKPLPRPGNSHGRSAVGRGRAGGRQGRPPFSEWSTPSRPG
jgi:hypothetical protein